MSLHPNAVWPHCDSPAPAAVAGEKDACGVGFLAQLQGQQSHWLLQQALRGLGCMEHRGGCGGDGDSGDGAGVLSGIPWSYLEAVWPAAAASAGQSRGLAMVFLPDDAERAAQSRQFCDEEAIRLGLPPPPVAAASSVVLSMQQVGELLRNHLAAVSIQRATSRSFLLPRTPGSFPRQGSSCH